MKKSLIGLVGKKFGKLTICSFLEPTIYPSGGVKNIALCKCDCGVNIQVILSNIKKGHTKSCGCISKEKANGTTHGESHKSLEYNSWIGMRNRCCYIKHNRYNLYGGRGIKVCDRWLNSYENFLADMGRKPTPQHSIDRIDVNGNYEPSNCRWATNKEQCNNRKSNRNITYNGVTKSITYWAEHFGINIGTLRKRIINRKIPFEIAITL